MSKPNGTLSGYDRRRSKILEPSKPLARTRNSFIVDDNWTDHIPGGLADDRKPSDFDSDALRKGIKVEMEHTDDPQVAQEIAMDHLTESSTYYDDLEKVEDSRAY